MPCDPEFDDCHDEGHDEGHDEDHSSPVGDKPWGAGLLAALLVNLCTVIGVVAFVPASLVSRKASPATKGFIFHIMIPSFACGALLATSVFLLIPESLVLLSGGHDEGHGEGEHDGHRKLEENDETEVTWKFGTCILAGYFIPFVFAGMFPHSHVPDDDDIIRECTDNATAIAGQNIDEDDIEHPVEIENDATKEEENDTDCNETEDLGEPRIATPDYRLAASILAGDFFDNFADGIFIGTAFLLCSRSIAITIAATTVFHELSQELADYFLLTNQCGFTPLKALVLNFMSGLSVMLGVIVIFAMDMSNEVIGALLALSAGVYLYIALTECAPRVNHYLTDTRKRTCSFLFWVMGAVPIGLVLLNHEHCG